MPANKDESTAKDMAEKATSKKAAETTPKIVKTKVKEWLRYDFKPEELQKMGLSMAQAQQQADIAEDEFKSVKSRFKDRIEKHQLVVRENSRHISTGFEMRDIDCEKMIDYKKGIVTFTRQDTGEVVEERDIRDEERQMKIVS